MFNSELCDIIEMPNLSILMPDGCRLSARAWMPVNAQNKPVPAVLEFLPYRKRDGTTARDCLTHPYFAKRGYACIRVDMRGNGDSEGVMDDEYSEQEMMDALSTINWLAAQKWCDGSVGMMGISWGGFNSLQAAASNPKNLKAIITLCSAVDRYAEDIHYKGGCLLNENLGWGATMWAYSSRSPDPALVGKKWRAMWLERLDAQPFLPIRWLQHQNRDSYWKHGSICEDFSSIKAATLAIGGWADSYKNAVPTLIEKLQAPVKGIVGPWAHKYPHFASPEPRIGFLQEATRWWNEWLKGIDTGVMDDARYAIYLMNAVRPKTNYNKRDGIWIDGSDLDQKTKEQVWHFGSNQNLESVSKPPQTIDVLISSPQDCGMESGEFCSIWVGADMPGDQRPDDAKSVCFTSNKTTRVTNIIGSPKVKLTLQSDKPNAQIAVRLNHIHPDGASTRITYAVLNLTHRDGHESPKSLISGETFEVELNLDHIAYQVPAEHQIRIAISSAYWPILWPSPEPVHLQIRGGFLSLPTYTMNRESEIFFPDPEAEDPWQVEELRSPSNSRKIISDATSGIKTLEIFDDFGAWKDADHGLVNDIVAREVWEINPDDPISAKASTHWTTRNMRDKWSVRTETYTTMTSDVENFYITARLEAFEADVLVFEKDVKKTILRDTR